MKSNNWLTVAVVLVAGILLIMWHGRIDILQWIVIAVGVMLIIPSIYSFIAALTRKRGVKEEAAKAAEDSTGEAHAERAHTGLAAGNSSLWASVGCMALGIWMVANPTFFVGLLAYVFGAILVLYGIYHIVFMSVWSRPVPMPWWFYIIPVLMIVAGVVVIFTDVRTWNSVIVLITGIALVASSVNAIFEAVAIGATDKAQRRSAA